MANVKKGFLAQRRNERDVKACNPMAFELRRVHCGVA
jgi:hypothetical protein